MKTYAKACILCEVVYTNPSHDGELTVVVLHPLLMWWYDDTIVAGALVSMNTLAGRLNL